MILFSYLSVLLLCVGIVLLLGLTPERITGDLTRLIAPEPSLRSKALTAQGRKKTRKLALAFIRIREALTETGKGGQFTMVCAAALFSAHSVRRSGKIPGSSRCETQKNCPGPGPCWRGWPLHHPIA